MIWEDFEVNQFVVDHAMYLSLVLYEVITITLRFRLCKEGLAVISHCPSDLLFR
jgi:hypothetical protein